MSGRGEAIVAQRRLDSQLKHQGVIAAVDAHLAAGHDLSIAALARHAGSPARSSTRTPTCDHGSSSAPNRQTGPAPPER